ncbi:probable LRR receptor-like serine/threonine-protein kinase At5g48740 [Selaginella moellendorffii]|nr:probable LRR receptor-like serine/threonine-protein kinase At5g48740 [Selaginella moellendorffii]|eukprot:XP_002973179.2 probable LRR receptor-like serine/threonine-protein kinase At5g48740 [Selaginella moellendorffii]
MKEGLAILLCIAFILRQISSQTPGPDFLSLSCGSSSNFTDKTTGLIWIPDASFVNNVGITSSIQGNSVRYFPFSKTTRNFNCYDIGHQAGLHLTRATFRYGNYDTRRRPPSFQFVMNQTVVSTVDLSSRDPWIEELVWTSSTAGATAFCLLATSEGGVPVISSLELRPLEENAYDAATSRLDRGAMLQMIYRINCGETTKTLRYPDDQQDRIWDIDTNYFPTDSTASIYNGSINSSAPAAPQSILQTSRVGSGNSLSYLLAVADRKMTQSYFIVAHFAMLTNTTSQTSFDILLNGNSSKSSFLLPGSFQGTSYSFTGNSTTSRSAESTLNITLQGIAGSPEINALEVYRPVTVVPPTTSADVTSLSSICSYYTITLGDHDPCLPVPWNGVKCSSVQSPQVEFLDLSGKGLKGSLYPQVGDLSKLTYLNISNNQLSGIIPVNQWDLSALETLDLSYNQLSGALSFDSRSLQNLKLLNLQNNSLSGELDSLVNLPNLQSVNVANNNFSGQIPAALVGKLQFTGNPCLGSADCSQAAAVPPAPGPETGIVVDLKSKSQTKKVVGIATGSAIAAVLVLALGFLLLRRNRSKEKSFEREIRAGSRDLIGCKEFSYRELSTATNGFKTELGKGSFGPVYHGRLANGQEVAIKVRSDASQLGADSFINEVSLLSRVHHQNLVELVGFCQKSKKQLLVYEFMGGGTLMEHLYGSKSPLDWKARVKIAVGAATALDYLHNGSDSKIIHRDVKSTNILLDSGMNAKVADFGLSKHVTRIDATHVTTLVKGTVGYLDPEYYASNQLTEKSDVYSFGVVLLELICGREPLSDRVPADQYSIITWARPYLLSGSYNEVVDRNIAGRFSIGSMAIFANVAAKSVARDPNERPKMSQVLRDLKEAQAFETAM